MRTGTGHRERRAFARGPTAGKAAQQKADRRHRHLCQSASITKLASPSPQPRCENSAARPRPAASPAIGPIQERFGAAAAAAAPVVAGAAAAAGAPGLRGVAAGWAGVWGCAALSGAVRCMPAGRPPPSRLASAALGTKAPAEPTINAAINQVFMLSPRTVGRHPRWGRRGVAQALWAKPGRLQSGLARVI